MMRNHDYPSFPLSTGGIVIPAKAGIQGFQACAQSAQPDAGALDSRLRGNDEVPRE
jgi:hypothetical protein